MSQVANANVIPTSAEKMAFAARLRAQTVACRVKHEKLGVKKALSHAQIKEAAATFDASGDSLSMAKKLIDTRDPAYRAVVHARGRASNYWRHITTPYPEPGIRLLRKDAVAMFQETMETYRKELGQAVALLQAKYAELRQQAQVTLGKLFNAGDYPVRVDTEFELDWDFPSVEPPAYLRDIHPQLYDQECERIRARFEEAARLTEQALVTKLHEMITHLSERLAEDDDGKPKVFRDSAVENLQAFFAQFKEIAEGGNEAIAAVVDRAQKAIAGVKPEALRTAADLRASIAEQLTDVAKSIDTMMVNVPKRAISLEDEA